LFSEISVGDKKTEWNEKKTTKAVKRRCMVECDCKRLQGYCTALRNAYQEHHGLAYDDYHIDIEEEIKTDLKS
jgi:hypothetical protein